MYPGGAAGPPKGIAKLLTVSDSGRMRSPPLVEKFRRAKENMLQNWQFQPTNGKLLSLERMFHEVSVPNSPDHLCCHSCVIASHLINRSTLRQSDTTMPTMTWIIVTSVPERSIESYIHVATRMMA